MPQIEAAQLVTASRMLYFTWIPADPDAVRALVPDGLEPAANGQCFINQYVVDSDEQTSGFAAYSLTYAGADLSGHDTPDGAVPGRWWTHYYNSNADMREYASARGVPAEAGKTVLEIADGVLTAATSAGGVPLIRTTARVGEDIAGVGRGQLRLRAASGRPARGDLGLLLAPVVVLLPRGRGPARRHAVTRARSGRSGPLSARSARAQRHRRPSAWLAFTPRTGGAAREPGPLPRHRKDAALRPGDAAAGA